MYSISSDKSIVAVNQLGQPILTYEDAHTESINKIINFSPNRLATGDDAGCVKIWDTRQSGHVMQFDLHEDFVSGMTYVDDYNTLLTTGGDATLCAYDLRKKDLSARSDDQESELHCVQCIKHGKKVVCGTQNGVILVFSWGKWGDCSDRFPGHPATVDCMLKVDENSLLTGSSDGLIRLVSLQPNKVVGVIGDHEDFPVEGMSRTNDGAVLASYSHNEVVRFWDVSFLLEDSEEAEEARQEDGTDPEETNEEMYSAEGVQAHREEEGESMDEEGVHKEEERMDEEEPEAGRASESDSDSPSDSRDTRINSQMPKYRLPSANERFFSDL
eukprot:CAMPEP_0182430770 /NCGR_PEP_ID=MMETSP1167-20130531/43205_1 /TAXON_ID=2988 /ORGANISM="Mallomonas Sp, Strain CCMP3275" /LENGTH=328 /DNA_ID=CAMNT_0024616237 /DNA_START=415 /DNA_END=1404 /DNA_ORIENTATION=-